MSRRMSGVVAVLVSLLVVGVVRGALPDGLPLHAHVTPDDRGVVVLDAAEVELLGVRAAGAVHSESDPERELVTDGAFVVALVRITPRGGTLQVQSDLESADGRTYEALDVRGFPYPGVVFVGQSVTQAHIFEVPADRVAGAHLMIRGTGGNGVQAIQPVTWFPLDVDVERGTLAVGQTLWEPAR